MTDPSPPSEPRLVWLARVLAHPRLPVIAVLGAVLLTLPSLLGPLTLDDYVLGLLSRGGTEVAGFAGRDPFALFTFTTGDPRSNEALMAEGVLLPWWTDPRHLNAFFRPLSSLTHRVDFALWPERPWLMHLHSLIWFLLLLGAAGLLYRSVHGARAPLAGLALLLFAWDDPHGATLGWIANRNAILASALALPAVLFHRRLSQAPVEPHRRSPARFMAGPVCFALGLCAGETAIGVLGYLLAHAVFLERDGWWPRLLRLVPYGIVLVMWRVIYRMQGLGSGGSGAYHDPIREPLAFLSALAQNLPVLLGAQFGPPYADAAFWGPPAHRPFLLLLSVAIVAVVIALALPVLRARADARFYALGCALSAVPVSASLPGERLLLLIGIGASGLIALLLQHYLARAQTSGPARAVLLLLLGMHLVAAPAALPGFAASMPLVGHVVGEADRQLPSDPSVQAQTFVIVNAPFDVMASYVQAARAYEGRPRPKSLQWLATASGPMTVRRSGPRSLELSLPEGLLKSPQARHYRGDLAALLPPARVVLPAMTVDVVEGDAERGPTRLRFTFAEALESDRLRLFRFRGDRFEALAPPGPGVTLSLPAQDFFQIVLRGGLRLLGLLPAGPGQPASNGTPASQRLDGRHKLR